jgi:hypothetical protein
MRKMGSEFCTIEDYHGFLKQKMGQYREFIWWAEQLRSCDSYCLMIQHRISVFFTHIVFRHLKACLLIVARWQCRFFVFSEGWCH